MPPAFNLSQDQTLQFNPCKVLHSQSTSPSSPNTQTPYRSPSTRTHRLATKDRARAAPDSRPAPPSPSLQPLLASCEHLLGSCGHQRCSKAFSPPQALPQDQPTNPKATSSNPTANTPSAHTYRLLVVKDQVLRRPACERMGFASSEEGKL